MDMSQKAPINPLKLWDKFTNGDQDSLGHIFQFYFEDLYFYGLKIIPIPDLVKDTIQDMFIRFWDKKNQLREVKKIKPYLLVTLRRELILTLKNDKNDELKNIPQNYLFEISIEDLIIKDEDNKELKKRLINSLDSLSANQREVILLRFYHGLEFDEIANVLEINLQSVRNLLFRALEKIRKDLKDLDIHNQGNLEIILFQLFQKNI